MYNNLIFLLLISRYVREKTNNDFLALVLLRTFFIIKKNAILCLILQYSKLVIARELGIYTLNYKGMVRPNFPFYFV